jgi:hypothetical protein
MWRQRAPNQWNHRWVDRDLIIHAFLLQRQSLRNSHWPMPGVWINTRQLAKCIQDWRVKIQTHSSVFFARCLTLSYFDTYCSDLASENAELLASLASVF